MEAVANDETVL